ncbi:thioesterase family protein [Streptomyces sp. NPDC087659]|uniref:thioesterase family protein n=1 Tax=Streptomyces sp. NPDC087659 TaxID=3365801 RepID=UPI0038028F8B
MSHRGPYLFSVTGGDSTASAKGSAFDRDTSLSWHPAIRCFYRARFTDGWSMGPGINSGVLLATAARALAREIRLSSGRRLDPLSLNAYYFTPAMAGAAVVHAEALKLDGLVPTGEVTLRQSGPYGKDREVLRVLGTFGDLTTSTDGSRSTLSAPATAKSAQWVNSRGALLSRSPHASYLHHLDVYLDPEHTWRKAYNGGPGSRVLRGWIRLSDGRDPDLLMLLLACDAIPSSRSSGPAGALCALQLSVHVHGHPEPGFLQFRLTSTDLPGGYVKEDADIWDSTGHLVARSQKLAASPRMIHS